MPRPHCRVVRRHRCCCFNGARGDSAHDVASDIQRPVPCHLGVDFIAIRDGQHFDRAVIHRKPGRQASEKRAVVNLDSVSTRWLDVKLPTIRRKVHAESFWTDVRYLSDGVDRDLADVCPKITLVINEPDKPGSAEGANRVVSRGEVVGIGVFPLSCERQIPKVRPKIVW